MRSLNFCALTFLLGCLVTSNAYAIEDNLETRVKEYERFKLTQVDNEENISIAIEQIIKNSLQNMFGKNANLAGGEFNKFVNFVTLNNTTLLKNKELQQKIDREVYTSIFTADELHAIADFFSSPAGKSYQNNALLMVQMSMAKAKQYMAQNGGHPSMYKIIQDYIASHPELAEEIYADHNKNPK